MHLFIVIEERKYPVGTVGYYFDHWVERVSTQLLRQQTNYDTANDMLLIPIEKIFSNRDSIRKAREAFLFQKGKTIDPMV